MSVGTYVVRVNILNERKSTVVFQVEPQALLFHVNTVARKVEHLRCRARSRLQRSVMLGKRRADLAVIDILYPGILASRKSERDIVHRPTSSTEPILLLIRS